jgi:TPP-dependent pyruvate/acetoin dehydrogenase alpha subunit
MTKQKAAVRDYATALTMFRLLVELRYFEKRAYDLFLQNLVKGTSHLSLGQEAVAAGFAVAMRGDDYTFCTYRGHHHTLARGAPMAGVLGELMGRECGLLGGKVLFVSGAPGVTNKSTCHGDKVYVKGTPNAKNIVLFK